MDWVAEFGRSLSCSAITTRTQTSTNHHDKGSLRSSSIDWLGVAFYYYLLSQLIGQFILRQEMKLNGDRQFVSEIHLNPSDPQNNCNLVLILLINQKMVTGWLIMPH